MPVIIGFLRLRFKQTMWLKQQLTREKFGEREGERRIMVFVSCFVGSEIALNVTCHLAAQMEIKGKGSGQGAAWPSRVESS